MSLASKLDVSEYSTLNRVVRWFIALRWIACGGVFAVLAGLLLLAPRQTPLAVLFLLNGILLVLNLGYFLYFRVMRKGKLAQEELAVFLTIQVISDYALLFLLTYFTGFLDNPLVFFFVFHILLTAYLFRADVAFLYAGALIAVFACGLAAEYLGLLPPHPPFPVGGLAGSAEQMMLRAVGLGATLLISAYLMTSIKRRIEEKGRRVAIELDRYKTLDRIKSSFILQVTHELRGPLAAINGYHEMIARGITGASTPRTLETIEKASRRTDNLLTMIDEMIDYAYMTSEEQPRLECTTVRMGEIIQDSLEALSNLADSKGIGFETHCPPDLQLTANRDLLRIILGNLVSNALKYSPEGTTLTVTAGTEGREVCLVVRDQGIGIAREELDSIFEEFYRARRARELERDGTGLGLSILKKAVERLGGRISVTSEVDKGSAFYVYLPREGPPGQGGAA